MLRELEVVMNSAMIYLYFLNGLFTALFYKLFFRKSGYSYAELCIGSLLSFSHFTLVYTILIIFGHYQNINTHFGTVLLLVAYQVWGMGGMFRPVSMSNYMKSFFASVLSVTLFSFISVFSISVVLGFMAGMAE